MNSPSREPTPRPVADAPAAATAPGDFFVVAVGASAGGLQAISELLKHLPAHSNLVVMVVQHLGPDHASLLADLLGRVSTLPVQWAVHGAPVVAGQVYVCPPRKTLSVADGGIRLTEPLKRFPNGIDGFLQSVAAHYAHRAVGVILSGNGSDGAIGARVIKGTGGIVFAQEPEGAQFPSMPRAAIETGCVDRVMTPAEIGVELGALTQKSRALWPHIETFAEGTADAEEARHLGLILRLVAARKGVDFSVYKPSTIKRRLGRCMMLAKTPAIADYWKLLQKDREEIARLHDSMLINVTEFFRDPECFEFLRETVLPEIVQRHADGVPIRVWVPGCSTGEEVYTLGILFRELLEERSPMIPVQIFGTDLSERVLAHARAGLYSAAEVAAISPERVRRFFHQTERGYLIQKSISDMCVFARQNIVKDAPFSRLDLLSCRNLLIYVSAAIQQRLMSVLHYALGPHGILMLGSAESIGSHTDLFRSLDRRFRLYTRRPTSHRAVMNFPRDQTHSPPAPPPVQPLPPMPDARPDSFDAIREADRIVAGRHGPPAILINDDGEIVQFRGDVMPYLAPVAGRATLKLLDLTREGLAEELQVLVQQARDQNVRTQKTGLAIMQGRDTRQIGVDVTPFRAVQTDARFFLLEFIAEDAALRSPAPIAAPPGEPAAYLAQITQLRQDLQGTRNYLQNMIEKHDATNQALRAANEEIQASNEELQSTNEELETAKEELQSTNEELSTVNEELHHRHVDLVQANNDLSNLIGSMHLPILILGHDLRIRRFTPAAEKAFNLIPGDIGRPLTDINTHLDAIDLPRRVAETIESLTVTETEVQDTRARWHSLRLRPYKTADHKIDGVVVTLIDIDDMKRTMTAIEAARDFERAVFETTREPLAALDAELRIKAANRAFYRLFNLERETPEARLFLDVAHDYGQFTSFKKALLGVLSANASLTEYEVGIDLNDPGITRLLVNARQIVGERSYPLILLSLQKIP